MQNDEEFKVDYRHHMAKIVLFSFAFLLILLSDACYFAQVICITLLWSMGDMFETIFFILRFLFFKQKLKQKYKAQKIYDNLLKKDKI